MSEGGQQAGTYLMDLRAREVAAGRVADFAVPAADGGGKENNVLLSRAPLGDAGAVVGRTTTAMGLALRSSDHGGDIAIQHAARQALLRRQYDLLRTQLGAARRNADYAGRYANLQPYKKLADVEKELAARRPPPLSMAEALRRVDAGVAPETF